MGEVAVGGEGIAPRLGQGEPVELGRELDGLVIEAADNGRCVRGQEGHLLRRGWMRMPEDRSTGWDKMQPLSDRRRNGRDFAEARSV